MNQGVTQPDTTLTSNIPEPKDANQSAFACAYRLETPVWLFDIDASRILFANAAACRAWQAHSEADLQARDLSEGMSPTVAARLKQYQADFSKGATFNEVWTLYPKGEPISLDVKYSGFVLQDGRYAMLCEASVPKDLTPENLRSAEALLHTDVMISLFKREGPPLYLNPAARTSALVSDQRFSDLFVDRRDFDRVMFDLDRKGLSTLVAKVYTEGGLRWHKLSARVCMDAATGAPSILVTANDVTDLKEARDKARFLAHRDQLTGCFNRTYLKQIINDLSHFQPQQCGLLFFDVDRFKQINDRFGHEAGDSVLKILARRAQEILSPLDILVRIGGDEFVILFRDIDDEKTVIERTERLLEKLQQPFTENAIRLSPTVSMGLTFFRPGDQSLTNAMSEADIALYSSKVEGRNRLTVFCETLGAAARARDQIEIDLKAATERQEFVLYYQPRIDIATRKIVSAEALVRWQHPTRGLVMPNEFIPVCEETGLIQEVGQIVLGIGLRQMAAWTQAGIDIELSINISPLQFETPELIDTLSAFAADPAFPAHKVELEVTENVLIGDMNRLAEQLREISALGFRIAIDDFGVGYSNLSYVSTFPADCLKIDRAFISRLPQSGPIVSLILALAKQIGAQTVAEGIETTEQAAWLSGTQCNQAQGYLFHRPLPLDTFMDVLTQSEQG
ncbi:MAG: bifunctional diguanylate cyclase/phosphodiesterase [Pseudomonadota bacterium]